MEKEAIQSGKLLIIGAASQLFSWTAINAAVLIISCSLLVFLFSETVYRDNYISYKRDAITSERASDKPEVGQYKTIDKK
jgi:hypothetical protein